MEGMVAMVPLLFSKNPIDERFKTHRLRSTRFATAVTASSRRLNSRRVPPGTSGLATRVCACFKRAASTP